MTGPFYDPDAPRTSTRSLVRDWAKSDKLSDINIVGVGKQGRLKAKAALQKNQARQDNEDPDDWFGRSKSNNREPPRGPAAQSKKISFGSSIGSQFKPLPSTRPPSLLERIDTDERGPRSEGRSERRDRPGNASSKSHRDRNRDKERDRERDRDHRKRREERRPSNKSSAGEAGPRYRGGYNR